MRLIDTDKLYPDTFGKGRLAISQSQIAEQPTVQVPTWIPVSERLPEKYTYTLWCASSGYVRSDYFNGEFWEDAKKYCYEVIAWMPLPKPYEPQESEDKGVE